jgi:hypothetical protein
VWLILTSALTASRIAADEQYDRVPMDSVALAATIGGSLVGIAGVAATAWSNWLQRDSAKDLASLQHQHERELARGARLYERRAPVYEGMLMLLKSVGGASGCNRAPLGVCCRARTSRAP